MCKTCIDGICTNRCVTGVMPVTDNVPELMTDAQALLFRLRSEIKTQAQYEAFTKMLEQQLNGFAAVLTVTAPGGTQAFIDPMWDETDNSSEAYIFFVPALAEQKAQLLNADVLKV